MKKRIFAAVMAGVMALTLGACGKSEKTDMEYVKDKGTLVIGITDFAPMDYQDENKNWIGFDADAATAFAKSLGVEAKFVEIEWDNKVLELDNKSIDCVWNGMTLRDDVMSAMSCTNAYCNNRQVVVVPKDKADKCQSLEDIKDLKFAVEDGSAGKDEAEANGLKYTAVTSQASALMEVAAGTSDGAIIDSLMAGAMIGEGTSYDQLTYTIGLNDEKYGVGFRKGSDLTAELNKFFVESYKSGELVDIAKKYGVQEALIEQK